MALMPTDFEAALTLYPNQRVESWPGLDVIELGTEADNSLFPAAMALIDVGMRLLRHKVRLNIIEQLALIAFERPEIVIAAIDNQLTGFFWVLMASKAITTPSSASCSMNSGSALISLVLLFT